MGVSVLGDIDKAAMYDNTSGETIGKVYRGHADAESELREFVNNWLPQSPRQYDTDELSKLQVAFKVEKGFLEEANWRTQVSAAESLLGREVVENSA